LFSGQGQTLRKRELAWKEVDREEIMRRFSLLAQATGRMPLVKYEMVSNIDIGAVPVARR
jgi:hypothetical protein